MKGSNTSQAFFTAITHAVLLTRHPGRTAIKEEEAHMRDTRRAEGTESIKPGLSQGLSPKAAVTVTASATATVTVDFGCCQCHSNCRGRHCHSPVTATVTATVIVTAPAGQRTPHTGSSWSHRGSPRLRMSSQSPRGSLWAPSRSLTRNGTPPWRGGIGRHHTGACLHSAGPHPHRNQSQQQRHNSQHNSEATGCQGYARRSTTGKGLPERQSRKVQR